MGGFKGKAQGRLCAGPFILPVKHRSICGAGEGENSWVLAGLLSPALPSPTWGSIVKEKEPEIQSCRS